MFPFLLFFQKVFNERFLCSSLRYKGRQTQSENRKLTQCLADTRKFIFFTPSLARVQLD